MLGVKTLLLVGHAQIYLARATLVVWVSVSRLFLSTKASEKGGK